MYMTSTDVEGRANGFEDSKNGIPANFQSPLAHRHDVHINLIIPTWNECSLETPDCTNAKCSMERHRTSLGLRLDAEKYTQLAFTLKLICCTCTVRQQILSCKPVSFHSMFPSAFTCCAVPGHSPFYLPTCVLGLSPLGCRLGTPANTVQQHAMTTLEVKVKPNTAVITENSISCSTKPIPGVPIPYASREIGGGCSTLLIWSHCPMQSGWYTCEQGSSLTSSPASNSIRHTAHCSSSSDPVADSHNR